MRRLAVLVCAALACDDGAAARAYGERYCASFCPDPMNARCLECGGAGGGAAGGAAGGTAGGAAGGTSGGGAAGGAAGGGAGGTAGGAAGGTSGGGTAGGGAAGGTAGGGATGVDDDGGALAFELTIGDGGLISAQSCVPAVLTPLLGGVPVALDRTYSVDATVSQGGVMTQAVYANSACSGSFVQLSGTGGEVWLKTLGTGTNQVSVQLLGRAGSKTVMFDAWAQVSVSRSDAGSAFCQSFIVQPVALTGVGEVPVSALSMSSVTLQVATADGGAVPSFHQTGNCSGTTLASMSMQAQPLIYSASIPFSQIWTIQGAFLLPVNVQPAGASGGLPIGAPCNDGTVCETRQCGGGRCLCTQRGGLCFAAVDCCPDAGCTAGHCRWRARAHSRGGSRSRRRWK